MVKTIIYQMIPRLWGNTEGKNIQNGTLEQNGCGKFSNIDRETFEYLKSIGVSHVWYTGVIRHATKCGTHGCSPSDSIWVKGNAGSPYSITDYFDVNPYLADNPVDRMREFEDLIKRTHDAGLKVLIDFVPNHVARDYGSFSPKPWTEDGRDALGHPVLGATDDNSQHWLADNDFFYYPGQYLKLPVKGKFKEYPAKASGNDYSPEPKINDWFDTIKINYCDFHTETWDKMYEAVRFWAGKGVDGFRCDMVELVPSEFLKWLIERIKAEFKDVIFVAEVYQKSQYRHYAKTVGMDLLYDKSGLYDAIKDIVRKNVSGGNEAVEEWQSTRRITGNWQSLGDLQPRMLNFLENHDEPRFPSPEISNSAFHEFSALCPSLLFNTSSFMLYFGQEIGECGMDEEGLSSYNCRTSIFDWWRVDSLAALYNEIHGKTSLNDSQRELLNRYRSILKFASTEEAIVRGVTYDLCYCNTNSYGFDKDRHFAFLRDFEDSTLLIISNFSATDADIDVWIPSHAFDWLGLSITKNVNPDTAVKVHVNAYDMCILRLQTDNRTV